MYTIQSKSEEGVYYLSSNWRKNNALWVKFDKLENRMLFKTVRGAKCSLTSLLKIMEEYSNNEFYVVEIKNGSVKEIEHIN